MNTNMVHNILNFVGLIIGALLLADWQSLGLSPTTAATVAAAVLTADKVIKLLMNVMRDGLGGLFKAQPPVKKD